MENNPVCNGIKKNKIGTNLIEEKELYTENYKTVM